MKTRHLFIVVTFLAMLIPLMSACKSKKTAISEVNDKEMAIAAFQKGGCGACHVIPGVPDANGKIGPDLGKVAQEAPKRLADPKYTGKAKTINDYILEGILDPSAFIAPDCAGSPCQAGLMPSTFKDMYNQNELNAMVSYLAKPPEGEQGENEPTHTPNQSPTLSDADFTWAKQTYFERCAGCHGTLRKGATGPGLTPDITLPKGTLALAAIIFNGTNRGMPDWGKQGFMTQVQTETMAKFLQMEPPTPPEMSLQQMKDSWKLLIAPDKRPTTPQTSRDWQNYFIVTLRDAGQVAIIDGDTYEIVNTVNSGYAVHITRMSASGRYAYVIGRDGKLAMIDLWMEKPDKVAEVQTCYDAR